MHIEKKGTVVILATGGTIAGVGDAGKSGGYTPGVMTAAELVKGIPGLKDIAPVDTIQVCNVNSDDITGEIWLKLCGMINNLAKDENVAGFVVTHGTDTLEETAYFLDLTVKTDKPVVLTGSMRPPTALVSDGAQNLFDAVCAAASKETVGCGVLVAFSGKLYAARDVKKSHTRDLGAINAGEMGAVGRVMRDVGTDVDKKEKNVFMHRDVKKCHTVDTEFDVSGVEKLPRVNIIYFAVDSDPGLIRRAAEISDGLVVAGAGAGEYSLSFKKVIGDVMEEFDIPVVISSRVNDGAISGEYLLNDNAICAFDLNPQKAAVLLRLALSMTKDVGEIERMFARY